jgi:hypothetical protein
MKGSGNIVSAIHHLKMASDHFQSFNFEHPGTRGARLFESYRKRIAWIVTDLRTNNDLPDIAREGVKREWDSDVFAVPAIAEKAALLSPGQREFLETMIERLLEGEVFKIIENQTA